MNAIIILIVMLALMVIGVPVAIALGVSGLLYLITEPNVPMIIVAQRLVNALDSFPLMAVPFFVLAGRLMNSCGATEKLFRFARTLVGHLRGGLGHVNVVASMIFAGMSGSAVADASGLGVVEIKAMREAGYDAEFSAAITGATSVIGPIIPPSIPMVLYGALVSVSVGRLFLAGVIPGVLLGVAYMVRIVIVSRKRNYPRETRATMAEIARAFWQSVPAILLPLIILGGIVGGIFTPTEAAAAAVLYSIFLGVFVYKGLTWKKFLDDLMESAKTVVVILMIIACAAVFSVALTRQQIPQRLTEGLLSVTSNPLLLILLINALLLVVGCLMEGTAALIILGPILAMVGQTAGIDPVFLGVVVILNLMTGLITPPIGMVLYVMQRLARLNIGLFMKDIFGFLVMAIIVILIVSIFPTVVTWLPNLIMGPAL